MSLVSVAYGVDQAGVDSMVVKERFPALKLDINGHAKSIKYKTVQVSILFSSLRTVFDLSMIWQV